MNINYDDYFYINFTILTIITYTLITIIIKLKNKAIKYILFCKNVNQNDDIIKSEKKNNLANSFELNGLSLICLRKKKEKPRIIIVENNQLIFNQLKSTYKYYGVLLKYHNKISISQYYYSKLEEQLNMALLSNKNLQNNFDNSLNLIVQILNSVFCNDLDHILDWRGSGFEKFIDWHKL